LSEKTYYLFGTDGTLAKFIVRGYSTKPDVKTILFCSATKEYIDCANLIEFTLEQARAHWSYLTSRGWYGIDTPQMDYAAAKFIPANGKKQQVVSNTNYALEA